MLANRLIVFVTYILSERTLDPKREYVFVQHVDLPFLERLIRLYHTLAYREELAPEKRSYSVRIDRNSDLLCRSSTRKEITLAEDRLFVLHHVLESVSLAEFRHPWSAILLGLESVFAAPLGEELGTLDADSRPVA